MTTNFDYSETKRLLEEKFIEIQGKDNKLSIERLKLSYEKENIRISFPIDRSPKECFYNIVEIITKQLENIQIHVFEPFFIVLRQEDSSSSIIQGIRFKIIAQASQNLFEIQKKGELRLQELEACYKILTYFFGNKTKKEPSEELKSLGVEVYLSSQKENNSSSSLESTRLFKNKIAGYQNIYEEILESIILPLQKPEIFQKVANITRGKEAKNIAQAVLFQGPAGVGKTTIARLIAQQIKIPLIYLPIENILSKYYGESAQNLAKVFENAALYKKAILFIDEIDALATSREHGLYEASRRLLSVLLRKIDGIESQDGILTIGATNRSEDLDKALLSRFDTIIYFPLPKANDRALIFRHYARHLSKESLEKLGHASQDLSGRDIEDICEYTERSWARQLIMKKKEITPPPAQLYLELCGKAKEKIQKSN